MIKAGQLRQGVVITYNGKLHEVIEAKHHKPGKGGAFIRLKLRNLNTNAIISETLRPDPHGEVHLGSSATDRVLRIQNPSILCKKETENPLTSMVICSGISSKEEGTSRSLKMMSVI